MCIAAFKQRQGRLPFGFKFKLALFVATASEAVEGVLSSCIGIQCCQCHAQGVLLPERKAKMADAAADTRLYSRSSCCGSCIVIETRQAG